MQNGRLPSSQRVRSGQLLPEGAGGRAELSAGHRKIILYAVPGKEPFYEAFGFRRMTTAMAVFEDPAKALSAGYLHDIEALARNLGGEIQLSDADPGTAVTINHRGGIDLQADLPTAA